MNKYTNIDEYISNFPQEVQVTLEKILSIAKTHLPSGVEAIRYGIPTIQVKGKNIVHFGGYPHHVAIYPASDGMIEAIPELGRYRTGKGTLQFKLSETMPFKLMSNAIGYLSAVSGKDND